MLQRSGTCLIRFTGPRMVCSAGIKNWKILAPRQKKESEETQLTVFKSKQFENIPVKSKEAFHRAIEQFVAHDPHYRRGHVEFINAALKAMKPFGVHKDLDTYKKILDVFPKGRMIARNTIQVELLHFPKQQFCAIGLLSQLEQNSIIPDDEFGGIICEIFGSQSYVMRMYQRIMFWLPKFRNANVYPVPRPLPDDDIELAKIALNRMCVDLENTVTVHKSIPTSATQTWIVSAQSPRQQSLISSIPSQEALFVTGPHLEWLRDGKSVKYFVLFAKPRLAETNQNQRPDTSSQEDIFSWNLPYGGEEPYEIIPTRSVHEQDDGIILAMCVTSSSDKLSLTQWVGSVLLKHNPRLAELSVVLLFKDTDTETETHQHRLGDTQ